jgi:transposase
MDGVVEIITGREGRRRWSTADKLRIVAETLEPGVAIRAVAARHDVCESLLFAWRRQVREGVLTAGSDMAMFMPVQMTEAAPAASMPSNPVPHSASPIRSMPTSGLIEIELGNGRHIRVGSDVNLGALRRYVNDPGSSGRADLDRDGPYRHAPGHARSCLTGAGRARPRSIFWGCFRFQGP